jgi:hypothetical protein
LFFRAAHYRWIGSLIKMLIVLESQAQKSGITGHKNFIGLIF